MSITGNIDVDAPDLISAGDVCELLNGRVSWQTVNRWMVSGIRGGTVQLDAIRIGRRLFTTRSALQQFVEEMSADVDATVPRRSKAARTSEHQRAIRKLKEVGIQ